MNNKELIGKKILCDTECCIILGIGTHTGDTNRIDNNGIFITGTFLVDNHTSIDIIYKHYTKLREHPDFMMLTVIDYNQFTQIYNATPFHNISWDYINEFQPILNKPSLITYTKVLYK